jgi:Kef-type K+ transport system membrane component KefB
MEALMQRYLVLILWSLGWAGLTVFDAQGGTTSWGMQTSAIGLMLLIGMTTGETMAQLGLPRLVGYIVTGLCFGPQSVQILGPSFSASLAPIEHLALAVLALRAGYQVDLSRVRTVAGTVIIALFTITVFIVVLGTVATTFAAPFITELTGQPHSQETFGVLISALLLVSSSAVVGSILNESDARGRMPDVVLTLTIGLELIALLIVTLTWAEAPTLPAPDAMSTAVSVSPLWTLVSSLGAGVALGLGLRLVLSTLSVTASLPLIVLCATLLPSVQSTGAGVAFVFSIAGLVARNLGERERKELFVERFGGIIKPATQVASLIFFTLFGVHLRLPYTGSIAMAAFIVVMGRSLALYLGVTLATRWSRAPEDLRNLGAGLLPQGPAALSVMVLATSGVAGLSEPIISLISGVVLIDLIVGSIGFKMVLQRSGLIVASASPSELIEEEAGLHSQGLETPVTEDRKSEDPLSQIEEPDDPTLHRVWRETRTRLQELTERVRADAIDARLNRVKMLIRSTTNHARHGIQVTGEACGRADDRESLRTILRDQRKTVADHIRASLDDFTPPAAADEIPTVVRLVAEAIDDIVLAAPAEIDGLASERHIKPGPGDKPWVLAGKIIRRITKSTSRFFGRDDGGRDVPYRRIVRRALGGELVAGLAPVETLVGRAELKALRRVETLMRSVDTVFLGALTFVEEGADSRELRVWLQAELVQLSQASQLAQDDTGLLAHEPLLRFSETAAEAFGHLTQLADDAGTFIVRESQLRYASVAPAARQAAHSALEERTKWETRQRALIARIELWARLIGLQNRLREVAVGQALGPAQRMHERVGELLEMARDRSALLLSTLQQELAQDDESSVERPIPTEQARALMDELNRRVARPLEGITHAQRSGAVIDRLLSALEQVTGTLPENVALLPEADLLGLIRGRSDVGFPVAVNVRSLTRTFFDRRVAVRLAEHMRALETSAEEALGGIRDATRVIDLRLTRAQGDEESIDGQGEEDSARRDRELWVDTLRTVLDRLGQELSHIEETAKALRRAIGETERSAVTELWKRLQDETRHPGIEEAVSGLRQRLDDVVRWLTEHPAMDRLREYGLFIGNRIGAVPVRTAGDRAAVRTGPIAIRQELDLLRPDTRGLPYVYGKLFSLDATENEAFIVERDAEIMRVRDLLHRSDGASLLLVGERGSGRTSVIRAALSGTRVQRNVVWLDADRPFSGPEPLLKWIGRAAGYEGSRADHNSITAYLSQTAPVLIVDGIDQIIERSQGGLEALGALSALMGTTKEQVVWIATVETGIWHLLREVTAVTDLFTEIVALQPLSADGLALAVRRRHRLSGQEVEFLPPDRSGLDRLLSRLTGQDPEVAYWDWLARQSRGNPRSALLIWMLSLVQRGERGYDVVSGQSLSTPGFALLPLRLAPVILLALEHGVIDRSHLARAMGWTELDASSAVSTLTATGILTRRPRADGEQSWVVPSWAETGARLYLRELGLIAHDRELI